MGGGSQYMWAIVWFSHDIRLDSYIMRFSHDIRRDSYIMWFSHDIRHDSYIMLFSHDIRRDSYIMWFSHDIRRESNTTHSLWSFDNKTKYVPQDPHRIGQWLTPVRCGQIWGRTKEQSTRQYVDYSIIRKYKHHNILISSDFRMI